MLAIYNKNHYNSLDRAINHNALYKTGSDIDGDYTSIMDNLESIAMTLKCVGSDINDFAVFYVECNKITEISQYIAGLEND